MKKTVYTSGQIPTVDDLDFGERVAAKAIEQTRYDLLDQQGTRVKGVVKSSGLTSSHVDDPLKVYITGGTVAHVYSGIAFDGYQGISQRIWVPDEPTDVPINTGAAVSNHDNIDMIDELQVRDFTTSLRPARTNLKEFTAADASGSWYISVRYASGTYDPQVIPSDGSQANAKQYESYVLNISQTPASSLFLADGFPWLQLGTLSWDGTTLLILSDDRLFASCIVTVDEEEIRNHQNRYHNNAILADDRTKLVTTITNGITNYITLSNTIFTDPEGMNINGKFIQTVNGDVIYFDATMTAGIYYAYINEAGTFLTSITFSTASNNLMLCSFYWNGSNLLTITESDTTQAVRDRRQFGAAGRYQVSNWIVGDTYDYDDDLSVEEASNELIVHRGYSHGNGIILDPESTPLMYTAADIGSLGYTMGVGSVTVNSLVAGDRLFIDGYELNTLVESNFIDYSTGSTGDKLLYASRWSLAADPRHSYRLRIKAFTGVITANEYAICSFNWSGSAVTGIIDRRTYGTIGYSHVQRNRNAAGNNNLPLMPAMMYGTITVTADSYSDLIYMTHDWGTGTGGGGTAPTSDGKQVFSVKPLIKVYVLGPTAVVAPWPTPLPCAGTYYSDFFDGPYSDDTGYSIVCFDETQFRIMNAWSTDETFYWIAFGPALINGATSIHDKNSPNYREVLAL